MTKPSPFSFDEFRASVPKAPEAPFARTYSAEDIAAAREEGVAEGRRLAMETIAADETAQLQRIGARLSEMQSAFGREFEIARNGVVATARLFLDEFCMRLASERELEIAEDMLRRLTENSEDRRTARLIINPKSLDRLKARLEDALDRQGIADFVTLDSDHRLQPGEARLEWRGGDSRRGRAELNAAIAALFDPLAVNETETPHERP